MKSQTEMATPSFHNRLVVTFVPNIRDPKAPTQEDINKPGSVRIGEADFTMSPWLDDEPPDDVGEPPTGWCDKKCSCGQPCGELIRHRDPCKCAVH